MVEQNFKRKQPKKAGKGRTKGAGVQSRCRRWPTIQRCEHRSAFQRCPRNRRWSKRFFRRYKLLLLCKRAGQSACQSSGIVVQDGPRDNTIRCLAQCSVFPRREASGTLDDKQRSQLDGSLKATTNTLCISPFIYGNWLHDMCK